MAWIDEIAEEVARAAGVDPPTLAVSPDETREILDIARIAAHASGARTNAPLLSYVLGMARARGDVPLATLAEAVRAVTGDPDAES